MNNVEFAEKDAEFREACKVAGVLPTRRMASKWRERQRIYGRGWVWTAKANNIPPEELRVHLDNSNGKRVHD